MLQPWHARYDAGVRPTLAPYPDRTLLDYLADAVRERPDHTALIFKGRAMSCAELDRLSSAFAASLAARGVRRGDRIALVLPNAPQFLIAELGAWKAGAVVVPLNPMYTEGELQDALARTGAEIVVALTPFVPRVKACQPNTRVRLVVVTNVKEYLPPLQRMLFTLFRERSGGHRVRLGRGDLRLGDLLRAHSGDARPAAPIRLDDPAVILMSGGTTGTAKGVVGSHRSYVMAGLQIREWVRSLCHDWHDTLMLPLPLSHVYANVGVQSLALIAHNPLVLVPNPREIDDVLATIDAARPTFFTGVPTLFIALCNHPRVKAGGVDFTSIKVCFSGAAPLLADTKRRFEDLTGGRLVEGYSLTEAMMACLVNPLQGANKIGSVGLPLPDVEVAIVDSDEGQTPLASGHVGEVMLRAPQLMVSYWNNAAETDIALRQQGDGGRWLHTGDLGYLDEDGYLFLVDRQKDLIKTSGYQVWPREIEEALASHPAVAEAGAGVVADPPKGQVAWPGSSCARVRPRRNRNCRTIAAAGWRRTRFRRASSFDAICRRRWLEKC